MSPTTLITSQIKICQKRSSPTSPVTLQKAGYIFLSSTSDGCIDGWMDRWMDGWMNGWMDGLMDGWVGGDIQQQMASQACAAEISKMGRKFPGIKPEI